MPTLFMYRFRTVNPITMKWYTARYALEYVVLNRRFEDFQTIGRPEVRRTRSFAGPASRRLPWFARPQVIGSLSAHVDSANYRHF